MNRKQRRAAAKLGSPPTQLLATALRLHQAGQLVAAEACYRQVLAAQPNLAEGHFNLGGALAGLGKLDEAVAACRRAIGFKSNYAEAHSNLGGALAGQGKLDEAVAACRQAIGIKPDFAEAHSNLGGALAAQGKLDEAVAACRQAIGIKPDFSKAFSDLLLCLSYDDKVTNDHLFAAHRQWDERYGQRAPAFTTYDNDRDATRRLRIGYVSPDFREHSVAYFVEPLAEGTRSAKGGSFLLC